MKERKPTTAWQLIARWLIFVGLVGIVASFGIVAITGSWEAIAAWATFGISFVVMVLCAILNHEWIADLVLNRRALIALNIAMMIVLAGLIMAGANYLAERRLPLSWRRIDITSRGLNKLSSQTRNMLTSLDKDVRICALLSNPTVAAKLQDFPFVPEARDLLVEYAKSSPHVKVDFVDMMRDPGAAWKFIIWVKLPKVLREHKIDPDAFKKAFAKSKVDTVTGFNLLRTIDTWDGPKSRIRAMAERKAGGSLEGLQFGKKPTAKELAELRKEFTTKANKQEAMLDDLLKRIKSLMADAKLDEAKQTDLLKAIKALDIPKPDANSVIFVCGDKSKHVKPYEMVDTESGSPQAPAQEPTKTFKGEDAFTAALKEVIEPEQMTVYFIEGHGEHRIGDYQQSGYSDLKSALEKSNYKVESLDLMAKGKIPDDCDVLVAPAPLLPYQPPEFDAIRRYLDSGGALFALADPLVPSMGRIERRPSGMAKLLKAYNIDVRENVTVLDVGYALTLTRKGLEEVPQIQGTVQTASYPKHRIVKDMQGRQTAFRWACPVDAAKQPANPDFTATRLLQGSKEGWGETDIALLKQQRAKKDKGKDIMAPVPIGAVSESKKKFEREIVKHEDKAKEAKSVKRPAKPVRIVAIGDSDFVTNAVIKVPGNGDLFVNAVSWLAGKESEIGIAPSVGKLPPLALTADQKHTMLYASVLGLPALWVLFGICVLIVRSLRNAGLNRTTLAKLGLPVGLLFIVIGAAMSAIESNMGATSATVLVVGVAVLAMSLIIGKQFVKGLFTRRAFVGANAAAMVLLALVVAAMVCFASSRRYLRSDWTKGHKHALAPAALQVVKGVKKWVNIHAMYPAAAAQQNPLAGLVEDALDEMDYQSDYIDINHVPMDQDKREAFFRALKLEPDPRTVVVFQSGDKVRHVPIDEIIVQTMPPMMMRQYGMQPPPPKFGGQQAFANALASVTKDEQSTIYFAIGHKERDINNYKEQGFGELHNLLRRNGYRVKTINLAEAGEVPPDCNVLVIAAPEQPYEPEAIDVLRSYCENNGRVFVMLEPAIGGRQPSGLAPLLAEYKINADESVLVVDSGQSLRLTQRGLVRVQQPSVKVRVTNDGYRFHDITNKLRGLPTVFYLACQVDAEKTPNQPRYPGAPPPPDQSPYKASELMLASAQGWGDTSVGQDGRIRYSEDEDKKGPIPFAACVEPKKAKPRMPWGPQPNEEEGKGPRIVCIGDADFASSQLLKAGNNANEELLMRCIHWLAKDEGEIKIAPTKIEPERIAQLKSAQKGWTLGICMAGLPLAWITIGLLVWGLRRVHA